MSPCVDRLRPVVYQQPVTYLDTNATAEPWPEIFPAMEEALREPGNPSSLHGPGRRARRRVEAGVERLASLVGASPKQVILTSGGTEANHLAVMGLARVRRAQTGAEAIALTAIEHPSVRACTGALENEGFRITELPVLASGVVDEQAARDAVSEEHALVAVMLANNETGVFQPVASIARAASEKGVPTHCDAVQVVGKAPVDFASLGVATLSLSAHKFGGPRGVGALIRKESIDLRPLWAGGGQGHGLRPGTEPVPLVVGMGVAAERSAAALEGEAELARRRDGLAERLGQIAGFWRVAEGSPQLANTLAVGFEGVSAQALVAALDDRGVIVGAGAACHGDAVEPSRVLLAMGVSAERALEVVRIALSWTTSAEDLENCAVAVRESVLALRQQGQP